MTINSIYGFLVMRVDKDDTHYFKIVEVLSINSTTSRLKPGDIIIGINDIDVNSNTSDTEIKDLINRDNIFIRVINYNSYIQRNKRIKEKENVVIKYYFMIFLLLNSNYIGINF